MFGLRVLPPTHLLSIYLTPSVSSLSFYSVVFPPPLLSISTYAPFLCRMSAPLLILHAPSSIPNLPISLHKHPLAHHVVCITAGSREVRGNPATPGAHRAWLLAAVSHP